MSQNTNLDLNEKSKPVDTSERKDPTSFLPEEPMSYEIKKKKKKKKKRIEEDDPFKDIEEKALVTERIMAPDQDQDIVTMLDPEVTIKVENIEVELDFNDFTNNDDFLFNHDEDTQEPEVKLEQTNKKACILTFEKIVNDNTLNDIDSKDEIRKMSNVTNAVLCKVCHLLFKNKKSLQVHQKRRHKIFRKYCTHICDDCGMSYDSKNSLVAHIKRKHGPNTDNDNELKACDECALVFKGSARLRMHKRRKHGAFEDSFTHVCEECGLTYEKYRSLVIHRRRKHSNVKEEVEDEWFKCPFCPKIYNKRETYARHIQRVHHSKLSGTDEYLEKCRNESGEIRCKHCPLLFTSRAFLKLHMRRKHNELKDDFRLKCRVCNMSYERPESLKRHVQRKHDNTLYCNVCRKQFPSRELFLNHSHMKIVNECSICGLIFSTTGRLGKHMRIVHKAEAPKVAFCNICNEGFDDKRKLRPHLMRVHYKVSYTCGYCKRIFKSKDSYHRHILVKHQTKNTVKVSEHKCEQCTETFVDEFELCKHVNEAHKESQFGAIIKTEFEENDAAGVFHCTKCPETFPDWDHLRSHYEMNHYVAKTCICQVCGKEVPEVGLQKHMKESHTENEELSCRYCDFKTTVRFTMTQHMLRHKNSTTLHCDYPNCRYKSYYEKAMQKHKKRHDEHGAGLQCSQCPFQTMNKYVLKYHEQNHDKAKKRYKCDQCDYASALQANLIQHKYKHSTEKRFKCEQCPFASKYNTSLRFHVRKKHCDLPS